MYIHVQLRNMQFIYLCSFHNKLKTNPRYLNHQVNRRCDDLVEVLLKFEQDQFYDRMRKEVMLTPQHASVKVDGEERHIRGEAIPDTSIKVCIYVYTNMINTAGNI